jgi:plastocyanin domain-containing protein
MRTTLALIAFASLVACKKPEAVQAEKVKVNVGATPPSEPLEAPTGFEPRQVKMQLTADGFAPDKINVKKDEPLKLLVTRTTDETCATELLIDGTDINVPLPLNKPVEIAFTPKKTGNVKFGCAMEKMVGGVLIVE